MHLSGITPIADEKGLDEVLRAGRAVLFKHSPT